jgi:DNA-binding Lrp family transcriptional regulator
VYTDIFVYSDYSNSNRNTGIVMNRHPYLLSCLAKWLGERGMKPAPDPDAIGALRPDIIVRDGANILVVEARVANAYRSKVFPALVGDAILRAQQAGRDVELLVAFLIKKLNSHATDDLRRYATNYLPTLNWFVLDERGEGKACLRGRLSELSFPPYAEGSGRRSSGSPPGRGGLFSPGASRLLKSLLLPGIDPRYWGGAQQPPEGIVQLAKASGVSQPAVSSMVKRLEAAGYVRRKAGIPVVIRHAELLDDWFYALKHDARAEFPVRSMYGDPIEKVMDRIRARYGDHYKPTVIVGHHMACHLHGVGRSNAKTVRIYATVPNAEVMDELELVTDESATPSLWLVRRDIESVRLGAVIADGVPVCDILQCYLDVRSSRARGQEQADYILENILMPHFRRQR